MHKALLVMLIAAAACGGTGGASSGAVPGGPTTQSDPGAATPKAAITAFMAAIKLQDLDALSLIWGSEKGAARDIVPADQLRKRELIMECYFQHDRYVITSDVESSSGLHVVMLSVTKGSFTRETQTQVLLGPKNRWYVANPSLEPLKDLCAGAVAK